MKTIQIKFRPTQIIDPRKWGSTLQIGQILTGELQLSNNCVSWDDVNDQSWCFWLGDTAELIEIESKGKEADLYNLFLDLKSKFDYWGNCTFQDISDFFKRNQMHEELIQLSIMMANEY